MSKRITATGLGTRAEFEAAVNETAHLQTRLRLLEAKRDRKIQAIQEEYAKEIDPLSEEIDALVSRAQAYAETHRDELFRDGLKSAETELATYGFRVGNPTLKTLNKKWTWETVLAAVKRKFRGDYIRTTEELAKDELKSRLTDAELAEVGCRIEQRETFGITPKVDGAETEKAA